FKSHIPAIADKPFLHTNSSYNTAIDQTLKFIEQNVIRHGGEVTADMYLIKAQEPKFEGKLEQAYARKVMSYQTQITDIGKWTLKGDWKDFIYGDGDQDLYKVANSPNDTLEFTFEGTGISLLGSWNKDAGKADVYINDKFV